MQARLNGETVCDGNSNEAIFGLDKVVAWASQGEILRPGWLLGSGTVNGGSTIEHDRKLSPGDNVELEIEGLGILRNTLGAPAMGAGNQSPAAPPATEALARINPRLLRSCVRRGVEQPGSSSGS
jgi:hypothetical protein